MNIHLLEPAQAELDEAVAWYADRFLADFMFQLSPEKFADLKSQLATSN